MTVIDRQLPTILDAPPATRCSRIHRAQHRDQGEHRAPGRARRRHPSQPQFRPHARTRDRVRKRLHAIARRGDRDRHGARSEARRIARPHRARNRRPTARHAPKGGSSNRNTEIARGNIESSPPRAATRRRGKASSSTRSSPTSAVRSRASARQMRQCSRCSRKTRKRNNIRRAERRHFPCSGE